MPTTSYDNWDFHNFHVSEDLVGGQFVSAETTLVAAGPPDLAAGGSAPAKVYPIGLLESVGLSQNKQLQRIFEVGSSRSYFVPGRTVGSLSIGRTFYFGPSLMRVMYAYYRTPTGSNVAIGTGAAASKTVTAAGKADTIVPDPLFNLLDGDGTATYHNIRRTPGEDYFFIDLASDLFGQPTGMAIYFKDYRALTIGAIYLNNCYVQGHQMNISSGSVLIMEGCSLQYDNMTPIKMLT